MSIPVCARIPGFSASPPREGANPVSGLFAFASQNELFEFST
jgi:hypothetical protein